MKKITTADVLELSVPESIELKVVRERIKGKG